MQCPRCHSEQIVKNGSIHSGKPKYQCQECDRQFVEDPQDRRISEEKKALIDRLLLERISLAGIARVVQVSERWLQSYANQKYAEQPRQVQVRPKKQN
jgi:transposase-like protein